MSAAMGSLPVLAVMAALACGAGNAPAAVQGGGKTGVETVKYRYEAVPKGGDPKEKEFMEIAVTTAGATLQYVSRVVAAGTDEEIHLTASREGRLIAGTRTVADRSGSRLSRETIRVEGGKARLEEVRGTNRNSSRFELPADKEFAVDGSLLLLFRSFPFDTGKAWNVFMVDFSAAEISVTVRQSGRERLVVPAGEFDCYRMEVVVNIPLLRPKITYWITAAAPHFLVKHEGKRGPFTSVYDTVLVGIGQEGEELPEKRQGTAQP